MVVTVLAASLSAAPGATARLVIDSGDPAFTGATVVPLTATNFGLTPGSFVPSFVTVQSGVQFGFSTTSTAGLFFDAGFVGVPPGTLHSVRPGVAIAISPGVSAISFNFLVAECAGAVTFTGAAGTEQFQTPFGQKNLFIGAADIGDISMVKLNDPCFAAAWSEMRFVPSTGTPPSPDRADLVLEKSASPLPTGLVYSLKVTNQGPDPAEGARIIDLLPPNHQPGTLGRPPDRRRRAADPAPAGVSAERVGLGRAAQQAKRDRLRVRDRLT